MNIENGSLNCNSVTWSKIYYKMLLTSWVIYKTKTILYRYYSILHKNIFAPFTKIKIPADCNLLIKYVNCK